MQTSPLKLLILEALDDSKARDVETLDVRTLTDVTDYMIICSGTSNRHTRSIADNLVVKCKANGVKPLAIEGTDTGEWILVDLVDVVVHIMLPQAREFYSLEKLWTAAAEVKAKIATPKAPKSKPKKSTATAKRKAPAKSTKK